MNAKTIKTRTKARQIRPVAVGAGLLALDAVVSADPHTPVRYWAGGTCGNVLTALAYLGWNSQPVARLGVGNAADLVIDDLNRWKLSLQFVRVEPDGSTPVIVERIRHGSDGIPKHSFSWRCTECGAPFPGYKPELVTIAEGIASRMRSPKVFFFDRLSAGTLLLAKEASRKGALVVFEPCSIGNPVLFRQAWEVSHVVKYSHERLSDLPEMEMNSSPMMVIETLGDAGLRYRQRKTGRMPTRWNELKAIPVNEIKDTAGAGDWCTAGMLSQIAKDGFEGFSKTSDEQVAKAIRFGQVLAAWNCGFEGARGGMYAVSKAIFSSQVSQILAGTRSVISMQGSRIEKDIVTDKFCRICDVSVADSQRKRSQKRGSL